MAIGDSESAKMQIENISFFLQGTPALPKCHANHRMVQYARP